MDFDDAKMKMSAIHKLHTARDSEGETIFYKKPYSARKITIITYDKDESFELNKVSMLSLDECGLLIQYKSVNENKMYPFPLKIIDDIIIESKI